MGENKVPFPGFVGPSYVSRSKRFDNQRCVNAYPEPDQAGGAGSQSQGKNQQQYVLIGTPGLPLIDTLGTGPIRATYTLSNQSITIVVTGNEVYQLSGVNAIPVLISGNLNTSTGPVSVSDNGVQILMVDGQYGYYITIGDTTLNTISDANFYPADTVTFQDGYFILNQTGTTNFFISDLYSVSWLPLNQSAKTGNSDILIGVISINRQLYLLGARTMECWWDAGASGSSPFQRQDGKNSQMGCASPATIVTLGETFYWLGSNGQGGGIVYTMENNVPKRISTHAVEYSIQQTTDLSGATAYAYQQEGHYFFVLNVPGLNTTWVYDMSTNLWHERQSSINGNIGRHLAQTHCVLNNVHIVGDYTNGNIYTLDLNTDSDNGQMIPRIRQTPHVANNNNMIFYHLIELDFQFGVGLSADATNVASNINPSVILEISRDGGETWGLPRTASLGKIGKYTTRARFSGLGSARDGVFRITVTDAVNFQLLSCMVDFTPGKA